MRERYAPVTTSAGDVRQIEQICDRFEAAWRAGERPRLESYLTEATASLQGALLLELLPLDWEYRLRAGDPPQFPEYSARFPAVRSLIETIGREVADVVSVGGQLPERLGRYRVLRRLGRGGMGVVYEAIDDSSGQRVALKLLPRLSMQDATARERFRREALTTARLHHPHIVPILEVGEHDRQPFLALEFVDGPTLAELLRKAPQSPRQAATLVETLARAVHYAHEQGVVHRDLKPANVLLARMQAPQRDVPELAETTPPDLSAYTARITDFGLAHPVGETELTATGDIVGTPAYMAPEQAWGKSKRQAVGRVTDVYALGAVLYEALTGRPPFQAATTLETLEQVRSREPMPPARLQPGIPRDLETICLKCLAKEPLHRYATALELAEDMRRFREGQPIVARRTRLSRRCIRWCRSNPGLASTSVFGLVALLAASALAINHAVTRQLRDEQQLTRSALADARVQRARAEANARELARQQALTQSALIDAEKFRRQAERLNASLCFERGLALVEQGDVACGLLLLGQGLEVASQGVADYEHVLRVNIAAAYARLPYYLDSVQEQPGEVRAVAFHPRGDRLLTGGRHSPPQQWDAVSGAPLDNPWSHRADIHAVAYSPGGHLAATGGSDGLVHLWNAATGEPAGEPLRHSDAVLSLAFGNEGATLVTGSRDGAVRIWRVPDGQLVRELASSRAVYAVACSADGRRVAAAGANRLAQIWDAATGQAVGTPLRHPGEVWALAFRPDGRVLVAGSEEGGAWLWDAESGVALGPALPHQGPIRAAGYSVDGQFLWTAGAYGKVRQWHTADARPAAAPVQLHSAIHAVAWSLDQQRIATGSADGGIRLWSRNETAVPAQPLCHDRLAYCLAISPQGDRIVTGSADPHARIWNTVTGQRVGQPMPHRASVLRVSFSPDGNTILTGSSDGTARLWHAADGKPLDIVLQHADEVHAVAFSRDGRWILTGCKDGKVQLWDASTGAAWGEPVQLARLVHAVTFSPDGQTFLTACEDGTARLWDRATGAPRGGPLPHRGPVRAAAFSPDGRLLLTGTWDDRTARLWDATNLRPFGPPLPHDEHVLCVAFSPDGQTMATGTWDGSARLWDVATLKPLGPPIAHRPTIRDVAFSPDGGTLWTASFDRSVRAWSLPAPVSGDAVQIVTWIQVVTGLELDSDGLFRELDAATWQQRRQLLDRLGGSPFSFSRPVRGN